MNIILFDGDGFFPPRDPRYLHIKKILRKNAGDSFRCGMRNGPEGTAFIRSLDEQGLRFDFTPERPMRPLFPAHLIIGFPRPIQLKRLLRDVASLGVSSVTLTGTELGEKSYRDSTLVDRGAAAAALEEGCVQAGGTAIPRLEMTDTLKEAVALYSAFPSAGILLDTAGSAGSLLKAPLAGITAEKPLVMAIGSERGWTAGERAFFAESGYRTYSLGPRILRTETAATAAIALALAGAGFWEENR